MTEATTSNYWISSTALYIELNAIGNPDYIQASCVSEAKILVYVKDIIGYDAGHNYRRWTLQAAPTVFNTHTAKYVYFAIPKSEASDKPALVVYPSEKVDIYGKNASGKQVGDDNYYYIYSQGIISDSGTAGTTSRTWKAKVQTGVLSSDEALSSMGGEGQWWEYSSVDDMITFLKDIWEGTIHYLTVAKQIIFNGHKLTGVAEDGTDIESTQHIVTPKWGDDHWVSSIRDDTAEGHITFNAGLTANQTAKLNEGATFGDLFSFDKNGNILAHTLTSSDYNKLAITDDHEDKKGYTIAVKDSTDGTYKLLVDELRAWSRTVTDELVAKGTVSNGDFISGFLGGKGWGITSREVINSAGMPEEKWTAEFDNLVVRGGMKVYEMVVSQLVGENDNRVFTGMLEVDHYDPTTGKVYLDTNDGQTYNPFRTGDYIMVQRFTYDTSETADVTKGYELIVEDYGSEGEGEDMLAWVTFNNFTSSFVEDATPETMIAEGDTFVRVDNVQDPDRKGIVQIVSVGTATPYMDVIHGLKTDPDNALKARLGNLQGIVHPVFGKLLGFGLYSSNAYLTGDFVIARTGESIDTKFQILEDRFSSQIAKTEDGLTDENNFLHNGRFCLNDNCEIDGWMQSGDDAVFYLDPDGNPLFINGQTTMDGQNRAVLDVVGGKKVLHLYTDGDPSTSAVAMTQANALIKQPTKHKEYSVEGDDADTAKDKETEVFDTMYLSCKLLPKAGTKVSVLLGVNDGYTLSITKTYDKDCTMWQTEEVAGVWDGKGDFVLSVDGDCYVTDVMLTTDPVASLAASYSTNITQTAKKIELQAKKVTKQGESISALEVTASGISAKVTAQGESISTLEQTANSISAKVSTIEEGLEDTGIDIANKKVTVTANNFAVMNNSGTTTMTVDKDGNLCTSGNASFKGTVYASAGEFTGKVIATSGEFTGKVTATSGSIGGITIAKSSISSGKFVLNSDGSASFANGNAKFNADGSISLASSKFQVDKSGNATMNNVTMNNVTANSGTFNGVINASSGLFLPVKIVEGNYTMQKGEVLCLLLLAYTGSYTDIFIYLPSSPNPGQTVYLRSEDKGTYYGTDSSTGSTYGYVHGNGHKILAIRGEQYSPSNEVLCDSIKLTGKTVTLVYDGAKWIQISVSGT